jgi:hypothetical protein
MMLNRSEKICKYIYSRQVQSRFRVNSERSQLETYPGEKTFSIRNTATRAQRGGDGWILKLYSIISAPHNWGTSIFKFFNNARWFLWKV